MNLSIEQKRDVVRNLAELAALVEADGVSAIVVVAVHPNETRTQVVSVGSTRKLTEQLILALEKVSFTLKFICYAPIGPPGQPTEGSQPH